MKNTKTKIVLLSILLSLPLYAFADKPDGSEYIDGGTSKTAILLAHGKGKQPT